MVNRYYIEEDPSLSEVRDQFPGQVAVFTSHFYNKLTEAPSKGPNTLEVSRYQFSIHERRE